MVSMHTCAIIGHGLGSLQVSAVMDAIQQLDVINAKRKIYGLPTISMHPDRHEARIEVSNVSSPCMRGIVAL